MKDWLFLERYMNEGTRVYAPSAAYRDLPRRFDPVLGDVDFALPLYRVLGTISDDRLGCLGDGENVLLPLHPAAVSRASQLPPVAKVLRVAPLANARTVLVLSGLEGLDGKFVKLHYPRRLSRFRRDLTLSQCRFEVAVVEAAAEAGLPVLPDLGFVGSIELDVGAVVRDTVVVGWGPGLEYVPLFSMYGQRYGQPRSWGRLFELAVAPGDDLASVLVRTVVKPMFLLYRGIYESLGAFPSLHGQNVLLGVRNGEVREVGFRGGSMFVLHDSPLRGFVEVPRRKLVDPSRVGVVASLTFDKFIGTHVLDLLYARLGSLSESLGSRFLDLAIDAFIECLSELLPWPAEEYYYSTVGANLATPLRLSADGGRPRWRCVR